MAVFVFGSRNQRGTSGAVPVPTGFDVGPDRLLRPVDAEVALAEDVGLEVEERLGGAPPVGKARTEDFHEGSVEALAGEDRRPARSSRIETGPGVWPGGVEYDQLLLPDPQGLGGEVHRTSTGVGGAGGGTEKGLIGSWGSGVRVQRCERQER